MMVFCEYFISHMHMKYGGKAFFVRLDNRAVQRSLYFTQKYSSNKINKQGALA